MIEHVGDESFIIAAVPDEECREWHPDQGGQIRARLDEGRVLNVVAIFRASLNDEGRRTFAEWVNLAVDQLEATGDPVGNGWYPSSEQGWWHMVAVNHYDDLPEP